MPSGETKHQIWSTNIKSQSDLSDSHYKRSPAHPPSPMVFDDYSKNEFISIFIQAVVWTVTRLMNDWCLPTIQVPAKRQHRRRETPFIYLNIFWWSLRPFQWYSLTGTCICINKMATMSSKYVNILTIWYSDAVEREELLINRYIRWTGKKQVLRQTKFSNTGWGVVSGGENRGVEN